MSATPPSSRLGRLALRCQPDTRLVTLTREGSDPAFEEIVARYRPRLVSFAAAIAPAGRAEDVVQESLIRALGAIRRSDDPIELRPWLYRIVRNRALNDVRDEPSYEHLSEDFDGVPQPPDVAARREEVAAILARLKALPDAQRAALVQRELEGRSHEEIAAGLELTPGAVRGLIFRARTAMRDAAGVLIPMPLVRALAGSGGGGVAAVALGTGGGVMKLGLVAAVTAVAVGSGVAIESGGGHHRSTRMADVNPARPAAVRASVRHGSDPGARAPSSSTDAGGGSERGPGSGDGHRGTPGDPSTARSTSGTAANSGRGSGSSGPSGQSGRRSSGGPGPNDRSGSSGGGFDIREHSGSGDGSGTGDRSGSGGGDGGHSGSRDSGSGSGGSEHSGSGSSGDGGGTTTTTTTKGDGGTSDGGGGGSGSGGSGSGGGGTTTVGGGGTTTDGDGGSLGGGGFAAF